jgi:predicted N-acetyltransferase YhbS
MRCDTIAFFEAPDYIELLCLRQAVLRTPGGTTYSFAELEQEREQLHRVVWNDEQQMMGGYLIKPVQAANEFVWQMRQVAVSTTYQRQGVGRFMIQDVEQLAKNNDVDKVLIEARLDAVPFYVKCGYVLLEGSFINPGSTLENKRLIKYI